LNRMTFGDRCKALRIEMPGRVKVRRYTREELAEVMTRHHGCKSEVARVLGLSRATLDRQLRDTGVQFNWCDRAGQDPTGEP
jgi:DNA-binding NtrC family response regulator